MTVHGTFGRRLVQLRNAVLEALGRTPPAAPMTGVPIRVWATPEHGTVVIGTCGSCEGPLVFDRGDLAASCPCGDTRIPSRLLRMNVALGKPGPR